MTANTILISDATYKHSIALARYLKAVNPSLHLIGCSPYKPKFQTLYQKFYDEWEIGAFYEHVMTIPHLLAIPVGSHSVQELMHFKPKTAVLPKEESFQIAMSKSRSTALANKLQIPTPDTFSVSSMEELGSLSSPFPWVVKGVWEAGKNIVHYVNDLDEARKAFYLIQNDVSQHDHPPIIQEFVKGKGIGFFAFYQDGILKRHYIHQRIRETPHTGGSSTAAETIHHTKAFEYGKKLLDALQWNGPAMVEFKEDQDTKELKFLEINPKLWGSLELGLAAGINFGDLLIRTIEGEVLTSLDDYKKVKFYWPFEGDLISILKSGKWLDYLDYFKDDYLSNVKSNGCALNLLNFFRYMR